MFFQESSISSTYQPLLAHNVPQHDVVPAAATLANLPSGTSLSTALERAGITLEAMEAARFRKDISTHQADSLV